MMTSILRTRLTLARLALTLVLAAPALSQDGVTNFGVRCDDEGGNCQDFVFEFAFPNGVAGTAFLSFEGATGLRPGSFEISAELVDPRDPQRAARLPAGVFIPDDFPVLVEITPADGTSGLSFRGRWSLELVSENLEFSSHTPYRLFRADRGQAFRDISVGLGSGSLRLRSAGGKFSEFVIAADLRPIEQVIGGKLARLKVIVESNLAELGELPDELRGLLESLDEAIENGRLGDALNGIRQFVATVLQNAGTEIPDSSDPDAGLVGLAAELRSLGDSVQHSVQLLRQSEDMGRSGVRRRLRLEDGSSVEVALQFEQSFVVDPEDLDIQAELVDPHDPGLLDRLPDGVHVPEEFPVLVRINPRAGKDAAFSGRYEVELSTADANFLGNTNLRLFKAPDGGAFNDSTLGVGFGSLRLRSAGGKFSEFLVVSDLRPMSEILGQSFGRFEDLLEDNASQVPVAVRRQLRDRLGEVKAAIEDGELGEAIGAVDQLIATIAGNRIGAIPAVWRASDTEGNLAGELQAFAESLRFTLTVDNTPLQADPEDVNRDGKVDVGDVLFLIDRVFGDG